MSSRYLMFTSQVLHFVTYTIDSLPIRFQNAIIVATFVCNLYLVAL